MKDYRAGYPNKQQMNPLFSQKLYSKNFMSQAL